MSTRRSASHVRVRRAIACSAGAFALCMSLAGTAYAETPTPLPQVPSTGDVITTLDQTVKQVTGTDPGLAPPAGTTPTAPTAPSAPAQQPTTVTKRPAATTRTAAVPHTTAPRTTMLAPAAAEPTVTWVAPPTEGEPSLPPATTTATVAGPAPAIAPLLIPQVTQRITPAAAMLEADKHSGSPVRAILLTLAVAAALGLGYEHGRLARRGVPG